jgi:hypothetical protein
VLVTFVGRIPRWLRCLACATLVLALLLTQFGAGGPTRAADASAGPHFVAIQGDGFLLDGRPITIKGANYYQRDAPWNDMWQRWYGPQVAQEITIGANQLGLNTLRVLVPYGAKYGWTDATTGAVNPVYLDELRQLVQIAGDANLRVILTLFDFSDDWGAPGSALEAAQLNYLTAIVSLFRDDDRVLAWDLHNEPDHYPGWQQNPGAAGVVDWLARMAAAVRRLDANHPLTIGFGAYQNFWTAQPGQPLPIDLVDFVAVHDYDGGRIGEHVRDMKTRTGKPILLEEVGWPTGHPYNPEAYSEATQEYVYEQVVATVEDEHIAGAVQWLLWDLTAGPAVRSFDFVDWMGLFRRDGSLKPAGAVFATLPAPPLPASVTTNLPLTGTPAPGWAEPLWFPQTGHWVAGVFKDRWLAEGGLARFGLPLTEAFTDDDAHDRLLIQVFERGVMQFNNAAKLAPGYAALTPAEQLDWVAPLQLVGSLVTAGRTFPTVAPFASTNDAWYFAATGHSLGGDFLAYWLTNGGLAGFGYPISEPFQEQGADGIVRTVQYFERARFESHPEATGTPYAIQLGQLGREVMHLRGWGP